MSELKAEVTGKITVELNMLTTDGQNVCATIDPDCLEESAEFGRGIIVEKILSLTICNKETGEVILYQDYDGGGDVISENTD